MALKNRGGLLPLTYIFGSFFGAAMIAIVFAYSNYRFSKYKFINFSELIFYEKSEIFIPKDDKYLLIVFSSNQSKIEEILKEQRSNLPVVAVDMLQKRGESNETLKSVSSDINTILKLINTLNITAVPSKVEIVRQNGEIYKQDSQIIKIE
ncbi:hypothetical protein CCAL13119_08825 [Campylobacter sp. RM13119]|uniref:hypothetical protein n=1 Tax=Campylobacter californiensis TaxID=1032243 RepID=UPI0014739C32|nr:hypothetical protein [Campylobacter sp. RM13119]MBE3607031.1 hypothetical protein [Campylobacter sp. RM13119]